MPNIREKTMGNTTLKSAFAALICLYVIIGLFPETGMTQSLTEKTIIVSIPMDLQQTTIQLRSGQEANVRIMDATIDAAMDPGETRIWTTEELAEGTYTHYQFQVTESPVFMTLQVDRVFSYVGGSTTYIDFTLIAGMNATPGNYTMQAKFEFHDGVTILATAFLNINLTIYGPLPGSIFTKHVLDWDFDGASAIHAADIDGDGDIDILGAADDADEIAWWRNDGGNNYTKQIVTDQFRGAHAVYAADIDGDGDTDILGGAQWDDELAWWRNEGGGIFTKNVINDNYGGKNVFPVDIDGDGDIDVLAPQSFDDIGWWENDGASTFTSHFVGKNFGSDMSLFPADMDGDGDMDVVTASESKGDIAWWENNGYQSFTEHSVDDDFTGASAIMAADIDSDGDMDILSTATWDNRVAWWEQTGPNTFTKHIIPDQFRGDAVYASDIDGDGDMDILGASSNYYDIAWWENDGSQQFTQQLIFDEFEGAKSVYATDLDGDGDVDVMGAADRSDDIVWWENNTTAPTRSVTVTMPNGGETLNGSTQHEIVWTSDGPIQTVKIEVSLNGGVTYSNVVGSTMNDGSYMWTVPDIQSDNGRIKISSAAVPFIFDVSDGDFTMTPSPKTITVLQPNGGESWEIESDQEVTWTSTGSIPTVKIEYSLDGGATFQSIVESTPNDGSHPWNVPQEISDQCVVRISDAADPSVSDMSDAQFTIFETPKTITVTSPNGGEILKSGDKHTVRWTSTGNISTVKIEFSENGGQSWTSITPLTLNGGAYSWTVPTTSSSNCLVRVSSTSDPNVNDMSDQAFSISDDSEFVMHIIDSNLDKPAWIHSADMDSDGHMDILCAAGEGLSWWKNDGSGQFSKQEVDLGFANADFIRAADIDLDGDLDVLGTVGFWADNEIAWWENNGSQSFSKHLLDNNFDKANSAFAADFDGDGDLDIIGAAGNANDIALWENDGAHNFQKRLIDDGFTSAGPVLGADLDNDGDVDILSGTQYGGKIAWWTNDGFGQFTQHIIDNGFSWGKSIDVADVDGDGDLDVLGASESGDELAWWENDGEETFAKHSVTTDFDGAFSIHAADLDGDSDIDIIAAAEKADEIAWWENDGEQTFTKTEIATDFNGPESVYSADLDGDGDRDIIAAAEDGDILAWWECRLPDSPNRINAQMTTVIVDPDRVAADGVSTATITVTPNNYLGDPLGSGQIVTIETTLGTLLNQVNDQGDGSYTQELQSSTTGTAVISATVNGVKMVATSTVHFTEPTVINTNKTQRPESFSLGQNIPNPFNPTTVISFTVPERSRVTITLFNLTGQKIMTLVDHDHAAGFHRVKWSGIDDNGNPVKNGVYVYKMISGNFTDSKKLILMR